MTNAIETAAVMYTINSLIGTLIVAAIVTYLMIGAYHEWSENRKFRRNRK